MSQSRSRSRSQSFIEPVINPAKINSPTVSIIETKDTQIQKNICAAVAIAASSNPFASTSTVTMTCATAGVTIRYTTNGSIPTLSNGSSYSVGLVISADTTYNAIAFLTDYDPSPMTTLAVTKIIP